MSYVRLIASCLLALPGCVTSGSAKLESTRPPLPVVSGQKYAGIIVPRFERFADSWTPTEEQVFSAEPRIQECILSKHKELRSTLPRYFRQYSGWSEHGRSVLKVQLFDTRTYRVEELRLPLVVCDGDQDNSYFYVSLDLESKACIIY